MKKNHKISCAVVAILSSHAAAVRAAGDDAAATEPSAAGPSGGIAEVVVTAERRAESSQDVPITVQALTSESLQQLNVTTLDDYVKYLPNVFWGGNGPGQGEIYMRGLSTGQSGVQGSGALGSFPNVALYLDDQSAQVPGRNLDIYAADLERIEVLEGPQGTLFGAGAEAGVVRYITNKPRLDVTEGKVNASYATTAGGDPSTALDATLNVPLVADTLAARVVIYDERRGGYINNIQGTFSRAPTDLVSVNYFGGSTPPNSGPVSNGPYVSRAFNPVTYQGVRGSLLWKISDDWNALLAQTYQNMDAQGVFWEEEYDGQGTPLPPMSVQIYNPTDLRDKFSNTALTINGRISALQFVYAGAYLDRTTDQVSDYTAYSRGEFAGYYQCNYPGYPFNHGFYTAANAPSPGLVGVAIPTPGNFTTSNAYPGMGVSPGYCYSPQVFWTDYQVNTHQSHEMRLSTPDDWRLRGLFGLYWEKYEIDEQADWHYGTSPNFEPIAPPAGVPVNNPNVRLPGDVFFNDIDRGYKQSAAFASLDFELLPKTLIVTLGTRYYHIENFEYGANTGSFGCEIYGPYNAAVPPSPCGIPESNGAILNGDKTYTGFRSRANLSWHVTRDALLYYTWSQGFRPGGFNRPGSVVPTTSPIYPEFTQPPTYAPDQLTNNEVGWKTEWLDHRLQWNGALYQEDWQHTQITIFDPSVTGNLTFTTNGPDYRVRGIETTFLARATEGLTITASAAWNTSEVVKEVTFTNPSTGQPIELNPNPFGALGQPLANCPPFEGNLRARYEFHVADYTPYLQAGVVRQGGSYSTTDHVTKTLSPPPGGTEPVSVAFYNPGYTTYNAALGINRDNWNVEAYGENLSDSHGYPFSFYSLFVKANTVIRPRTIGLRFSYALSHPK